MMWIAYPSRVDSASLAVAELPALAQNLFEDLEQYTIRAEPSWRPDVRNISAPRAGLEVAYVDHYGVACPIALFQVCPPEEGPDGPESTWWLRYWRMKKCRTMRRRPRFAACWRGCSMTASVLPCTKAST